MKKIFFVIIIIFLIQSLSFLKTANAVEDNFRIIASDSAGVTIEVKIPQPDISVTQEEDDIYHKVVVTGFVNSTDIGKPQLPVKGSLIAIPNESEPTIEILESDQSVFSGYNVYPVPKPELNAETGNASLNFVFTKDRELYNTDAFYPSRIAEIGFTGYMRDQKVAQIKIFPVQFNPVTDKLLLHSMVRIRINFNIRNADKVTTKPEKAMKKANLQGMTGAYERVMQGVILNYSSDQ